MATAVRNMMAILTAAVRIDTTFVMHFFGSQHMLMCAFRRPCLQDVCIAKKLGLRHAAIVVSDTRNNSMSTVNS